MRVALLALSSVAAGCTVGLGPAPDGGACAPAPDYFVSDVWPRYVVPNQCANRGCHDFADGHGYLRFRPPEPPPAPGLPLAAWPTAWAQNYLSAIQLVRCDQPLASRLLTVPEGIGNLHPPGPVVLDRVTAAQVLTTWVAR
jgi:hypothetical protein